MKMKLFLRFFPICLTIVGIFIHLFGVVNCIPGINIPHLAMFLIDFIVVIGLLSKSLIGYYMSILLYGEQVVMQPYWAYQKFLNNFFVLHPCEWIITPILVTISLSILLFNK